MHSDFSRCIIDANEINILGIVEVTMQVDVTLLFQMCNDLDCHCFLREYQIQFDLLCNGYQCLSKIACSYYQSCIKMFLSHPFCANLIVMSAAQLILRTRLNELV